jgi:sugar lactone lactonase YvrE
MPARRSIHVDAVLSFDRGSVFFDRTVGPRRLKHPEGIAVATDGAIWCGGEGGEIYRIEPDGSDFSEITSSGGFTLGLAFDAVGNLFACDLAHAVVYRLAPGGRTLEVFARGDGKRMLRVPNFPVVHSRRNCLYVSDSHGANSPGPGIWRFDLTTDEGELWYDGTLNFANGMALAPDRASLYVLESFARRVVRIPIQADGSAGDLQTVVEGVGRVPDGLAFDREGTLYISCYEPSCIYRYPAGGPLELWFADPEAHLLCHPTNIAFRGPELFTSNLGRWHITRIEAGIDGAPLLDQDN